MEKLRKEIDTIDQDIITLLKKRMNIVESIIQKKIKKNSSTINKEREKKVKSHWQEQAKKLNLDENKIIKILEAVLDMSVSYQNKLRHKD